MSRSEFAPHGESNPERIEAGKGSDVNREADQGPRDRDQVHFVCRHLGPNAKKPGRIAPAGPPRVTC